MFFLGVCGRIRKRGSCKHSTLTINNIAFGHVMTIHVLENVFSNRAKNSRKKIRIAVLMGEVICSVNLKIYYYKIKK